MPTLRIAMDFLWIGALAILMGTAVIYGRSPRVARGREGWALPAGLGLLLAGGLAGLPGVTDSAAAATAAAFARSAGLMVLIYAVWAWVKRYGRLKRDRERLRATNRGLEKKVAQLQDLESQQKAILTGVKNVGLEFLDSEMRMIWANPSSLAQTGNTAEDVDGRRCYEIRRGLDTPCPDCHTVTVLQTGEYQEREARKDDGRIYFLQSNPVRDSRGRVIGVLNADTDITDRKQAERALRRSEEKYRTLVETISEAIYEVDAQGTITTISSGITKILGYQPEEIVGRAFIDFTHPEDRHRLVERFAELRADVTRPSEYRVISRKGTPHWVETFSQPRFKDDRFVGLVGVMTDIHKRKRLEIEAEYQKQLLEATLNATPDGIIAADQNERILTWNHRFEEMLALSPEGLAGMKTIQELAVAVGPKLPPGGYSMPVLFETPVDGAAHEVILGEGVFEVVTLPLAGEGRTSGQVWNLRDVTQARAAESALTRSEERFSKLFNASPIWSELVTLEEGRFIEVNQAFLATTGFDREEVVGHTSIEIGLWEDAGERESIVAHFRDHNRLDSRPCKFRMRDGKIRHFLWSAEAVEVEGMRCLISTLLDVTERRRAEEKLLEEKQFSETLINSLPGYFYLYAEDGRLLRWNRNLENVTDMSSDQIGQTRMLDWFAPGDQRLAASAFLEVLEHGEGDAEIPVLTPSGRKGLFYFRGRKLSIKGHTYMVGTALDITEHKKLEAALRESEKRFRHLVEQMPFGICIAVAGKIVYRNAIQEKLLGPLVGSVTLADAPLPSEDRTRYLAACDAAVQTGRPVDGLELRFYPHGKPRDPHHLVWMHCSIHPVDYQGRKALLIAMVDLTRMKELEQQVLIREKMASLGHVAAGIAHEIRNPLSGINVLLEGIRENFQDPESADDIMGLLNETQKASDKIAGVIRRVLDFSKPSPIKMQLGDINVPVQEAVQLTQVTLRKREIALDLDLATGLPDLYLDHQLIEQVVINLINNAATAVDARNDEKRIRVTSRRETEHLSVAVADSGLGISETLKGKIFNPFFTTRSDGSGIGLSLCQRIASDHGGVIEVGPSKLGGAEFRLRLPLEKRRHPR